MDDDLWRFEITADRFLRNMVRAVVGTLIEVGRGRLSLDDFKQVVQKKSRQAAGDSMPGNALSLVEIEYPAELFEVNPSHDAQGEQPLCQERSVNSTLAMTICLWLP